MYKAQLQQPKQSERCQRKSSTCIHRLKTEQKELKQKRYARISGICEVSARVMNESGMWWKLEIRSVEHGICPIAEFTSPLLSCAAILAIRP